MCSLPESRIHKSYYWFIIMAARQLCWPSAILFYCCSLDLLFSPPNLRGRLADRHRTLPHVRRWPRFIKFGQKFGWPPKFDGPKTSKFLATSHNFATWSRISPERNKTSLIGKRRCKLYYYYYYYYKGCTGWWRFGLVVTRWSRSTKLLYVGPA